MTNSSIEEAPETQPTRMARFLRVVEALGNALPHPVTLFALFSIFIVLLSGVLGWLGAGRLAELRVIDRPMGGRLARYGPSRNPNFPFVLFGRARYHCGLLAARTHAMRDVLELDVDLEERLPLEASTRRALAAIFGELRKRGNESLRGREAVDRLMRTTEAILRDDEARRHEIR